MIEDNGAPPRCDASRDARTHCSLAEGHTGQHVVIPGHGTGPIEDYGWVFWQDP